MIVVKKLTRTGKTSGATYVALDRYVMRNSYEFAQDRKPNATISIIREDGGVEVHLSRAVLEQALAMLDKE